MTTIETDTQVRRRPLLALAKAEYLQFLRNKTLVFNATAIPVGVPLLLFFLQGDGDPTRRVAATTLESFALAALIFVQFYSILSMVTTRRGEGVLKRLRTGEAADWQILVAPAVPGVLLTLGGGVLVGAVVYGFGAPAPVNVVALVLALVGGLVLFSLLALATSALTKNAEAAQVTSLPIIVLAVMGVGTIRELLPDGLADVAAWTPFAAVSDLIHLGAAGVLVPGPDTTFDLAGTFAEFGRPAATLVLWIVLALVLVSRGFRWDDRG